MATTRGDEAGAAVLALLAARQSRSGGGASILAGEAVPTATLQLLSTRTWANYI